MLSLESHQNYQFREPLKLSIFSYDICFDFRLNHEQNKKN